MFVGMQLLMTAPISSSPAIAAEPQRSEPPSIATKEALAPKTQSLPTPSEMAGAAADEAKFYRIATGDTLARIALRRYGDAGKWRGLAKANPGLDPRRLKVGATIMLPETIDGVPASSR